MKKLLALSLLLLSGYQEFSAANLPQHVIDCIQAKKCYEQVSVICSGIIAIDEKSYDITDNCLNELKKHPNAWSIGSQAVLCKRTCLERH